MVALEISKIDALFIFNRLEKLHQNGGTNSSQCLNSLSAINTRNIGHMQCKMKIKSFNIFFFSHQVVTNMPKKKNIYIYFMVEVYCIDYGNVVGNI